MIGMILWKFNKDHGKKKMYMHVCMYVCMYVCNVNSYIGIRLVIKINNRYFRRAVLNLFSFSLTQENCMYIIVSMRITSL